MDDPGRMRLPQRLQRRYPDLGHAPVRQPYLFLEDVGERSAVEEFHDDDRDAVVVDDVVDRDDAGIVEPGGDARLLQRERAEFLEAGHASTLRPAPGRDQIRRTTRHNRVRRSWSLDEPRTPQ